MVDKTDTGQSGSPDQERNAPKEGTDAPKGTLEKALASWDSASKGTDGDGGKKPQASTKDQDEITELRAELSRLSYESDMKALVTEVRGDLDVDYEDVERWLNTKADKDPRLTKAWDERHANKSRFQDVVKALVPEYQEYVKSFATRVSKGGEKGKKDDDEGKNAGKDDKGLAAAVRQARDAAPSNGQFGDVKWAQLSDNELAAKKSEVFRAAKAGAFK
jgi:hypothetical protein